MVLAEGERAALEAHEVAVRRASGRIACSRRVAEHL
jgi:hypothetical protein